MRSCLFLCLEREGNVISMYTSKLRESDSKIEQLRMREPELDAPYWIEKFQETVHEFEETRQRAIALDKKVAKVS